jgi:hypothetical protein
MAIQEPALTQTDPKAYYLWLQTQGLNPVQAVEQVRARFGAPKSPEQQQKEAADNQMKQTLAQTGGMIGGTVLATKGIPALTSLITGPTTSSAIATPTLLGAKTVGAGAATTGTGAGAGAGATTAGGTSLSSIGSVALPVAIGAAALSTAWESGMKDILRGRGNRADYTNQAVNLATGFIPNMALNLMGKRSIGKMMTTGKSDAQLLRDDFRGLLKQTGVADDSYNVTLADGSQFNIGLDGKTKLQNVGENIDKKKTRNAWDVDFSNPLAKFAVGKLDPMVRNIYEGSDGKLKLEQYTGMLVNAATSNAKSEDDVIANINAMLGKSTFAKQAGINLPEMPKGRQVAPIAKTPQVSTPEGKAKSNSIRDVLQQNMGKK